MSFVFLRAMIRDPKAIGSVWPSSPALARAMVAAAGLTPSDRVVEVGAGTGPVTRVLATHPGPCIALEPEPTLAAKARLAAPAIEVIEGLAEDLPQILAERNWEDVNAIISSLPFAAWDAKRQDRVVDVFEQILAPGGRIVTFTYLTSRPTASGRRLVARLEQSFGTVTVSPVVWACLPPCVVYSVSPGNRG